MSGRATRASDSRGQVLDGRGVTRRPKWIPVMASLSGEAITSLRLRSGGRAPYGASSHAGGAVTAANASTMP